MGAAVCQSFTRQLDNAGARIPAGECWLPCLSVNLNELLLLDGRQAEPYTIRLRSKSSFAFAFRAKRDTLAVLDSMDGLAEHLFLVRLSTK